MFLFHPESDKDSYWYSELICLILDLDYASDFSKVLQNTVSIVYYKSEKLTGDIY